jgi:zinc protease
MKTTMLTLLAFLAIAVSPAALNAQGETAVNVTELRSENSPLITIRVVLRTGSINDPAGKEGLNALTANLIGSGGTQELTYSQVLEKLYPWAAGISTQCDQELTTFTGNIHRDHLEAFYKLFTELLLAPRFDSSDYARVKEDALNYLKNTLRSTDDEGLGKEALNAFLFEGHPYGTTEYGTVRGIGSVTLDDVKAYYRNTYNRANLWVGIAGGYPAGFADRIRADFAKLPAGTPAVVDLPAPPAIEGTEVMVVQKPARAYAVSMGFPISVTRKDRDFYALMVANSYFGEHRTFNGVLMNRLRGDRGMNYGDYSYIEKFTGGTGSGSTFPDLNTPLRQQYFSIWLRPMPPSQAHFAIRNALFELKRLVENGLTEKDFEQTRKFVTNYSKLWAATMSRRLGYLMDSEFYGTPYFIDRIDSELKTLTVADVNAAIKKYLNADNIKIAVVVDEGQGREFFDRLANNTPSPITYDSPKPQKVLDEDKLIEVFPVKVNRAKSRVVEAKELFEK